MTIGHLSPSSPASPILFPVPNTLKPLSLSSRQSTVIEMILKSNQPTRKTSREEEEETAPTEQSDRKKRRQERLEAPLALTQVEYIIVSDDEDAADKNCPKIIELSCTKCGKWIMDYLHDEPGKPLLRCYVDRIRNPFELRSRHFSKKNLRTALDLRCDGCLERLGYPVMDQKKFPKPQTRAAYMISRSIKQTENGPRWHSSVQTKEK